MNHQGKPPTLIVKARCSQYLAPLKKELSDAGYWAIQSFDLQNTRALHEEGCTCTYHDTGHCTCEMVVLLIYPAEGEPVTLMLDGRDGFTFVYLMEEPGNTKPAATLEGITQVLLTTAYQVLVESNQETLP